MRFFDLYRHRPLRITKGGHQFSGPIQRILLIQLGDIGDLVLSIPTIRSLKENYPSAHLTVAARDKAGDLMHLCPWADEVLPIKKEKLKLGAWIRKYVGLFRFLRSKQFDLAIDMRTGTRGGVLAFLSGARIRMGYTALDDTWRNWLFTHLVYPPMNMTMLHSTHYNLMLLNRYDLKLNPQWPRLYIDELYAGRVDQLLLKENVPKALPLIAIQPFSLWHYKEWGTDKFRRLIQHLLHAYDVGVLVCGAGSERSRAAQMISGMDGRKVFNMAGKTTIAEYAALLAKCRLFIGCDSAGIHLAASVQAKTAAIYGPTPSDSWAPREHGHIVIKKAMDCIPCHRKGCQDSGRSICLEKLTTCEVIEKVESLLAELAVLR